MHKLVEKFVDWCRDTSTAARFERTVAQGAIAVVVTGLTTGEWGAATAVGLIMAVLSPIQAEIGKGGVDD